jgi:hypothetical protein
MKLSGYDFYKLNKREIGDFVNNWFHDVFLASESKNYKVKVKYGTIEDFVISDEMWTVKKTDVETTYNLYNRKFNLVSFRIMCPVGAKFKIVDNKKLYLMKAQIHSCDDSQYGVWFEGFLPDLITIRVQLMNWIKPIKLLNGKKFIDFCLLNGADPESVDYN